MSLGALSLQSNNSDIIREYDDDSKRFSTFKGDDETLSNHTNEVISNNLKNKLVPKEEEEHDEQDSYDSGIPHNSMIVEDEFGTETLIVTV